MKVYVKAVVSIENLKTQFGDGIDDELFETLVNVDPTADYASEKGGKYCPWIFRKYKEGSLTEDDFQNLHDALGHFSKSSKKYLHSDLGQYKTVKEFLDDAEDVANRPLTEEEQKRALKKQAHRPSDADKEWCVGDDEWEVWKPLTRAGSIALSREGGVKARWCTAAEGDSDYYWKYYTKQGPLYIFINKNDPNEKYQTHFETGSYMYNIDDRPKGEDFFYRFCAEHPVIGDYFKVSLIDGVKIRAGSIVGFDKNATVLKIPEGVTSITKSIPSHVEELSLPDSMTELPERMLQYMHYLKKVRLPETITKIPYGFFYDCDALEEIEIPDSVTSYGTSAFADCSNLKTIKNSANLKKLGDRCFYGCNSLENYVLPDSLEEIGRCCFDRSSIKDISIPAGLTVLRGTFNENTSISKVDIANVKKICADTFRNSTISEIDLSKVETIGASAFRNCNMLTTVKLPNDIFLGSNAFADNANLTKINVPKGATLKYKVFDDCPNLTVTWNAEDEDFEFENIKLLICDASCTALIEANRGIVKIKTKQGDVYDIQ